MKKYAVWNHRKHKVKMISEKKLNEFPNREEILKDIGEAGEYRGEFILITEYQVKERRRW